MDEYWMKGKKEKTFNVYHKYFKLIMNVIHKNNLQKNISLSIYLLLIVYIEIII